MFAWDARKFRNSKLKLGSKSIFFSNKMVSFQPLIPQQFFEKLYNGQNKSTTFQRYPKKRSRHKSFLVQSQEKP